MVQFQKTCRECFIEKGQSILLKQDANGNYFCPVNPRHKAPEDDVMVA